MRQNMEIIMIEPTTVDMNWNGTFSVEGKIVPHGTCVRLPEVEKVVFHDPATIVYWKDGTKSVVKCSEGDKYDPEKGFAIAVAKKVYGSYTNFEKQMKKGNTV